MKKLFALLIFAALPCAAQVYNPGGSGAINAGTTNQLGYYAGNGTTISGLNVGTGLAVSGGALIYTGGSSSYPGVTSDGSNGLTVAGQVAANNFRAAQNISGATTTTPILGYISFVPSSNTSSGYTMASITATMLPLMDGQATADNQFSAGQFTATNQGSTKGLGQLEGINVAANSAFPAPIGYLAAADIEASTNGSVVTEENTILARATISAGHWVDSFGVNIEQYQTGTGSITGNQVGLRVTQSNSGSGTIVNSYGIQVSTAIGTTNTYGIWIGAIAAAAGNYSIYSSGAATSVFGGQVNAPHLHASPLSGSTNGMLSLEWVGTPPAGTVSNSVSITVPNGVTAYQLILPGAAPTGGNTHMSCTAAAPSVCSWGP